MNKQENKEALSKEDLKRAETLVAEVLKRTGIKKKLLREEIGCRILNAVYTLVNNIKSVPVVNWVATLVEKPLGVFVNKAEWRKDTRKNQWRLAITNEVRNMLNNEYKERSSVELKSVPAQYTKMHMDKIAEATCATIMARARNLSNKIAIGVGGLLVAWVAVDRPSILPIALGATAACTILRRKINKAQISVNIEAKSNHDNKAKEVLREHTQVLENSPYYNNIANFSSRMNQEMLNVSKKEIEANDKKQEVFRKNADKNTLVDGFFSTVAVSVPMALAYFDGGLSALATTGVKGAAICSTCTSFGVSSLMNYVNSKLEGEEAIKMVVTHMKLLDKKDKSFEKGGMELQKDDNVIVISKDMAYQHRNFNEAGAPLSGEDLFRSNEDIIINKGITVLGGASGAGKSTLISLLTKSSLATEGSIKLGHVNESGEFVGTEYKDIKNIVDNVGIAFQSSPVAESISVDDYIKLENPDADVEKVKQVKKLLGIGEGNESGLIDENASVSNRLSGGQQKRIELARVLIKDSPIMILDEPTSGVDEKMSQEIVEYLKELRKEKTIIYITHDVREIEDIGAYQAIDIDKKHSKNGQNVIKTFDLTDENERKNYVRFFMDRSAQALEGEKSEQEECAKDAVLEEQAIKEYVERRIRGAKELIDRADKLKESKEEHRGDTNRVISSNKRDTSTSEMVVNIVNYNRNKGSDGN